MSGESTSSFAARVAAGMFTGEALILLAVALLYRSDLGDGRLLIPSACASVGLLLFLFADRTPWRVLHLAVALPEQARHPHRGHRARVVHELLGFDHALGHGAGG